MCGIVGYINKGSATTATMLDVFKWALILNSSRGTHGCGIAYSWGVGDNKQFDSVNSELSSADYVRDIRNDHTVNSMLRGNKIMIGHSRAATHGDVNVENTHPFVVGNIIGVHNGSLTGDWKGKVPEEGYEVDSEVLYHLINEKGVQAVEEFTGAMSLVWFDTEKKTLNFYRNSQRPMVFATTITGDILFGSTEQILRAAAAAENFGIMSMTSTPTNTHVEMSTIDNELITHPEQIITGKSVNTSYSSPGSVVPWRGRNHTKSQKPKTHEEKLKKLNTSKKIGDTVILVPERLLTVGKNLSTGTLICSHGWRHEDSSEDDVNFRAAVYQMSADVADKILQSGAGILGEIESVSKELTVKIKKSNLRVVDITGNTSIPALLDELDDMPNAHRHILDLADANEAEALDKTLADIYADYDADDEDEIRCDSCETVLEYGWETYNLEQGGVLKSYTACSCPGDECRRDIKALIAEAYDSSDAYNAVSTAPEDIVWKYFVMSEKNKGRLAV